LLNGRDPRGLFMYVGSRREDVMQTPERTGWWRSAALAVAIGMLTACGGPPEASPTSGETTSLQTARTAATTSEASPLVGLWMQVHTCEQLVAGLEDAGLWDLAPATVGDFFPDATPEELAAKDDLCSGARPQRHFHFFTEAGQFGSLDQHRQQVDDGPYSVDGVTLHIGDETWGGTWTFEISGSQLTLTPVIDEEQIEAALADPFGFSTAGWMVAVAYPGTTWKRVACQGWC
jgi:hypothetical protein